MNKYKIALKVLDEYIVGCSDIQILGQFDFAGWLKDKIKETKETKQKKADTQLYTNGLDKHLLEQFFLLAATENKSNKITEGKKARIVAKLLRMGKDEHINYALNLALTQKITNLKWIRKVTISAKVKNLRFNNSQPKSFDLGELESRLK
jgi:hypothetical protein